MKVKPFHTITPEDHPDGPVYHDDNTCFYGKRIKDEDREPGTAGRRKCSECKKTD